ncbi:HAD-IA family hydrolase [uncultured Paraglaciecola sp.]|uniref:HAD-IA family hydrolase n=1 Tax=uncultured Paraglaciecola sp. TaxID=1765024 RepID=UPI002613A67F|nr:HAD-IA family hydrolase [uncultured Paraglaciecola sp.]
MIYFKKLNKIQAISFDLDDTLYENTSVIIKAERSLTELMHHQYPATKRLDKNFWRKQQKVIILENPLLKNDMGELRRRSLESGFIQLGLSGTELHAATTQCFEHFYFQRSNFKLNRNIYSLLKALSTKLPLVAITNGNVDLKQIGLQSYFSASFKSSVRMPMKPHKAMFDAAQAYLDMPHKNILHVGDNLPKDILGALKAGFQTAWYAEDRAMNIRHETAQVLPHVQLSNLSQLLEII